jgi:hypothetical protein
MFFIESLVVAGDLYNSRLNKGGLFQSGFSSLDLLILFGIITISLFFGSMLFIQHFRELILKYTKDVFEDQNKLGIILILCLLLMYESFQDILFLKADMERIHYLGYKVFLANYLFLLGFVFIASFQFILLIVIEQWNTVSVWITNILSRRVTYVFLLASAVIIGVSNSRIGDNISSNQIRKMHELNVPVIGIQVILIVLFILLGYVILKWINSKWSLLDFLKQDVVIMIILGLLAFALWSSIPLRGSTFTDSPRPPNHDFYPTSDALHYEQTAHHILVGKGLKSRSHIGFQVFLAFLHGIAGKEYDDILPFLLFILSLSPVLLYKLTQMIHTRLSGLIVSLLFIIKVSNSLQLGEHLTLASAADLMTEPISTLGIILFSTFLVAWYLDPSRRKLLLLIAGAGLGWSILFRIEIIALIPAAVLLVLTLVRKRSRMWLQALVILILGIVVVSGPWMLYRYAQSGSPMAFFMSKEAYVERAIGSDGSSAEEPQDRSLLNLPNYFPYHLVNNILQQVYILPSNHQPLLTVGSIPDLLTKDTSLTDLEGDSFSERYLERYIRSLPYWWIGEWTGRLVPRSYLPVLGTVMFILIGIDQIRGRKAFLAGLLGLIGFSHVLVYAIIGQSGGRSMQIVDWIPLIFYGIGISYLIILVLKKINPEKIGGWWFNTQDVQHQQVNEGIQLAPNVIVVSLLLMLLGVSYPLADNVIPLRYDQETLKKNLKKIASINDWDIKNGLEVSDQNENRVILQGRMITPRYFNAGDSMVDRRWNSTPDYSFSRIEFYLVGTENTWVALPSEVGLEPLPHGTDAIVIGTQEEGSTDDKGSPIFGDYIKAKEIYILPDTLVSESVIQINCSGPECKD